MSEPKLSEDRNIALDGVFNANSNSIPSSVGLVASVRNVDSTEANQTLRVTGAQGATSTTLDVSVFDSSGNPIGASNPIAVSQAGNWFVGQSGPFTVGQTGSWFVGQSGPFNVGQTGNWFIGQSGPFTVGQTGTWNVGATQLGNWFVGQSGPFNVGQTGLWFFGQSGPFSVGQTGNWFMGQSGPFNVSQTGTWNVGATQLGNWFVGQSGPFNVGQTGNWFVGQSGPFNVGQTGNWFMGQSGPFNVGQTGSWLVGQTSGPWTFNLTEVGGVTLRFGQTLIASSIPVVLASDQTTTVSQVGATSTMTSFAMNVHPIPTATSYYSASVDVRQTAATAVNATVWAMRNDAAATKNVYIERIHLTMTFDPATPVTPAIIKYYLIRFSAATPTGGTVVTPVQQDSSDPATQVTDLRFLDTGLTTTGVSFGNKIAILGSTTTQGASTTYVRQGVAIKLAAGQGFAIRLDIAAVIGQAIVGEIVWSEQ